MSKVLFTYKTGRERLMRRRDADLMRRLGQGTYMTRDMVAAPIDPIPTEVAPICLESLNKDELHALAKERGVKVHHAAGADRVRAALREAQE